MFDGLSISHSLGWVDFSPTNQVSNPTLLYIFSFFGDIGDIQIKGLNEIQERLRRRTKKRALKRLFGFSF